MIQNRHRIRAIMVNAHETISFLGMDSAEGTRVHNAGACFEDTVFIRQISLGCRCSAQHDKQASMMGFWFGKIIPVSCVLKVES